MQKKLYRYQLHYFLEEVEEEEYFKFAVTYRLQEIKVLKETRHTYVVEKVRGKTPVRVYKKARNTYAHETKEAALSNFWHRTWRHMRKMENKAIILRELLTKMQTENKNIGF